MRRSVLSALLVALPFAACSSSPEAISLAPVPVGGGFTATFPDASRMVVSAADGRVLLDGLPPGELAHADDPPLVGFAVREVATTYEMQFGAFRPHDAAAGPWRVASRVVASGGAVELRDAVGALLARVVWSAPEEGHLVAALEPGDGPERRFTWGFSCDGGDHFAGFGAQSFDVDHRGFTVPTLVQEQGIGKIEDDTYGAAWFLVGTRHASHVPIPQYLSSRGYLLTAQTDLRAIFALCSEGAHAAARVELDLPAKLHLFDGPAPAKALERATGTFGRPRMPPRVAFAPWLDAIFGSENVRAVAQALRAASIPSSVIWTEDWRGGDWGGDSYKLKEEWEVDTALYPDMKALAGELHGAGFDFFVYFNPFVFKDSKAWAETSPQGWLVKHEDGTDYTFQGATFTDAGLIDLDNPDARAWVVSKMRAAIALGADGWMNDFGEWLPTDGKTFAGPSLARHNVYPVLWQQAAREALDGVGDGVERLIFSRSGWFGTPPLVDVFWAGDQRTDFEPDDGLPTILPIGIGLGITGISTYGHDIAGYQSATNPTSTKELFFRWTELGAWSPVMRTHHGTKPKLEWSWQSDAETTAHLRRYAALHMSLVPYLAGLARHASDTGMPMWRGLMLAYPSDPTAWGVKDEVLLGDGVLVAPVMTQGATERSVYLPEGTWYPWTAGAKVSGGTTLAAAAPLEEIPVYAAAGAVVPTYPDGVMTLVHPSQDVPGESAVGDDRVVYAFLGATGSFTEDAGLRYELTHLADASGALELGWRGTKLAACEASKAAPCMEATADGAVAYVTGPGELSVKANGAAAATLTASGGEAGRALRWVVRR